MASTFDVDVCPLEMSPPISQKRKRTDDDPQPLTPPLAATDPEGTRLLSRAVHVLSTAATALSQVTVLYETNPVARDGLLRAIEAVTNAVRKDGKLIVCGVGKSGLVGRKIVATMKSVGIPSSFLHAAEALHGDLGDIRKNDVVMFVSYSGKTAELMNVLHHIPPAVPVLALTSHKDPSKCMLLEGRTTGILLPAPIHELEELSFGVCAPTTSTTVTIAVGDMLALSIAEALHADETKDIFSRNHPGGAIGAKHRRVEAEEEKGVSKPGGLATPPTQ